jgi:dienelactone hydrolase
MSLLVPRILATAARQCVEAPGFEEFSFSVYLRSKRVLKIGVGPAIVLMHELPGMTPQCLRLARLIAESGFTVYLPLLIGKPNEHALAKNFFRLCVSREFRIWASSKSSPVVDWLRALSRHVCYEHRGRGIGVIGMCLTGGFALAMVADPHVLACVASQPGLPFPLTRSQKMSLGLSEDELERVRTNSCARILGLRFKDDRLSPAERMQRLMSLQPLPSGVEVIELPSDLPGVSASPHSVLTEELQVHDPDHLTTQALVAVISMFRAKL